MATKKPAPKDPTAGWTALITPGASFSIKYPAAWDKNICDANFVLLGPTGYAGHCQSDATPEVLISSVKGDKTAEGKLDITVYPNLKTVNVTVDGAAGTKQTGTFQSGSEQAIGPDNGTKVIYYTLLKNNTTYMLNYTQLTNSPDVSKDFELLVNNTFKIL